MQGNINYESEESEKNVSRNTLKSGAFKKVKPKIREKEIQISVYEIP